MSSSLVKGTKLDVIPWKTPITCLDLGFILYKM